MVTSSAVVGSSAITRGGVHASAIGDHHALADCRQTADADTSRARLSGSGHVHGVQQFHGSAPGLGASVSVDVTAPRRSVARGDHGFSAVIGSWKTQRDAGAADGLHVALVQLQEGRGPRSGSRRHDRRGWRQQRQYGKRW
jgi:hypothetical protein